MNGAMSVAVHARDLRPGDVLVTGGTVQRVLSVEENLLGVRLDTGDLYLAPDDAAVLTARGPGRRVADLRRALAGLHPETAVHLQGCCCGGEWDGSDLEWETTHNYVVLRHDG